MIEYVITDEEKKQEVYFFEEEMLQKYKMAIDPYSSFFKARGFNLKVELSWQNTFRNEWSSTPMPLRNGYECSVFCLVEKDGELVNIKSDDGEVDYYPMWESWMISSVRRSFSKLKVSLYKEMDDIHSTMSTYMIQVESIFNGNIESCTGLLV